MDKNTLELIKELYNVSTLIYKTYINLAKFNLEYGKNSKEYKKMLKFLEILLFSENNLYSSLMGDVDKITDIIMFIVEESSYDLDDAVFITMRDEKEEYIQKRIIEKLYLLIYKNNDLYRGFIPEEFLLIKKGPSDVVDYLREYLDIINKEEIRGTVRYLSENNYKDIIYKYIFLNPCMENEMIANSFVKKCTFIDSIKYSSKYDYFNDTIRNIVAYKRANNLLEEIYIYAEESPYNSDLFDANLELLIANLKSNLLYLDILYIDFLKSNILEEIAKITDDDGIESIEDLVELQERDINKEKNYKLDILERLHYILDHINEEKEKINNNGDSKKLFLD